jgi:hypothetical protein
MFPSSQTAAKVKDESSDFVLINVSSAAIRGSATRKQAPRPPVGSAVTVP